MSQFNHSLLIQISRFNGPEDLAPFHTLLDAVGNYQVGLFQDKRVQLLFMYGIGTHSRYVGALSDLVGKYRDKNSDILDAEGCVLNGDEVRAEDDAPAEG